MVFSSFSFLFRFLPAFLLVYYIAPAKWRNAVLLAASLAFYTIGEPRYVLLLVASVLVNFAAGRLMYREAAEGRGMRQRALLGAALIYDFGTLFFFKYSGLAPKLPLGISFYTFQIAAYVIDVYRGKVPAEKSVIKLGTYLTMFPQLVAGPILNYSDVRRSLGSRRLGPDLLEEGLKTLILGLGAKVLIADRIGILWNDIRTIGFESISTPLAWMGVYAYSMELYFDFAGYSLMAMGLGKMIGFQIPANFKRPYMSKSVTEFWRRWHITLGKWFRDYVYIPLGGSRRGKAKTIRNLLVVWTLTALWHGAAPNYLIWGAALVACLMAEKLFLLPYLEKSKAIGHAYVLIVIPLTWVPFAITDLGQLGTYFARLFPFFSGEAQTVNHLDFVRYAGDYWPLFLLGILFATPIPSALYKMYRKKWAGSIAVMVILALSLYYMAVSANNPFMYFNF